MQVLPDALAPMANYAQFMGYRLVWNAAKNKFDKEPLHCKQGYRHSPVDPNGWGTFEEAARCPGADGVAFAFAQSDPFWFLDIDHALADGQWSELSTMLCGALAGCAVEVSQSGAGLHLFGTGSVPGHGCRNDALGLEFYTEGRFVALTGTGAVGNAAHDPGRPVLDWLVQHYFPPGAGQTQGMAEWTDAPVPEWNGYTDDVELIEAACRANSASAIFGGKAGFGDLWCADPDTLATAFPDADRTYNASQADSALALRLLFWTGKNCERTRDLMWQSALVRDKWEREDYLERTVLNAMAICTDVHQRARVEPPAAPSPAPLPTEAATGTVPSGEMVTGLRLLAPDQIREYFNGCVYVMDRHRIFVPSGDLLDQGQFKAMYGGYTFAMDPEMRRTVRNAWEAFTENQGVTFPKVVSTQFRPDLAPGRVFEQAGRRLLNNYVPLHTPRREGDPSPLLDHVARLLPDERDQQILLSYMAACVQHKGVKFQWCPLIQGVEGNGKTLLSRAVAEAVGMLHVHSPKAQEISNKFNSWIRDKVFIYVEDVYYPEGRREVIEALKPLVTNDWQPVEPKGVDQVTAYVVANLMLNSNHRDAIRKTRNDRRFAVFYTAQQTVDDLKRDGMNGNYFPKLYQWLKKEGGWAIVSQFLETYPIAEEFNPAGRCSRSPETSTTMAAIAEGLGSVEQEIQEAVDEGRPGFAGGWVSSMALDKLLQGLKAGRAIPPNKRPEMLRELGYVHHPGLKDGRVNNPIPIDGGKPRLFIRDGHIHANLTGGAAIAQAYVDAQAAPHNPGFGQMEAGK